MKVGHSLLVVLALVGSSSSVFGGPIVVFNNFVAGNTYNAGGWATGGSNLNAIADPFMPSVNTNLSSILIAIGSNAATAGNIVVSVRTDGSAVFPGLIPSSTILESWTLNSASLPAFGTTSGATETLNSVLNPRSLPLGNGIGLRLLLNLPASQSLGTKTPSGTPETYGQLSEGEHSY